MFSTISTSSTSSASSSSNSSSQISWERWWQDEGAREKLLARVKDTGSPLYAYSAKEVKSRASNVLSLKSIDRVFYAVKANPHPILLSAIQAAGLGFECVSVEELEAVFSLSPPPSPSRVLFTPNFAARAEYEKAFVLGAFVTVDNAWVLEEWPQVFAGRDIILRADPMEGKGHHEHVVTGGSKSKFGVGLADVQRALERAKETGARVIGLHVHKGSGVDETDTWARSLSFLLDQIISPYRSLLPHLRIINLGGGLAIPYRPTQPELRLSSVDEAIARVLVARKAELEGVQIWMEPGRYIVAQAGVLLTQVTQLKRKSNHYFIGVNAGMNALIRPPLYEAYHHIVNLSRGGETVQATVVGPICESGDVLGRDRELPRDTSEGDVVLVSDAGAYGAAMASTYNLRPVPRSIVL